MSDSPLLQAVAKGLSLLLTELGHTEHAQRIVELLPDPNHVSRFHTPGEWKVARRLVRVILDHGCTVSVWDSEAWAIKDSRDFLKIIAVLGATDVETIRVGTLGNPNFLIGNFLLVWGNAMDGSELISDHSDSPLINQIVKEIEK